MGLGEQHRTERRDAALIRPVVEPFEKFVHAESGGGPLLLGAMIVAMIWETLPGTIPTCASGVRRSVWWWDLRRWPKPCWSGSTTA